MFTKKTEASGWRTTATRFRPAVSSSFRPFPVGDFKDGFTGLFFPA
jgi:hypothetical protein